MNENIKSVAYGNGVYIAAAGDRILKSTDGENWIVARMTNQTSGSNQLNDVAYGDGVFVVCGQCYYYVSSDNGLTWTEHMHASYMEHVIYGGGKFILASPVAGGVISINSSTLEVTAVNFDIMDDMAFVDGNFYGIKRSASDQNLYLLNGTTWHICFSGIPAVSNRRLRGVNGRLFLGAETDTYEFVTDIPGSYRALIQLKGVSGQMLDACEADGKTYIMTASALYEEEFRH